MCRVVEARFRRQASAPGRARRLVQESLTRWGLTHQADLIDTAMLLTDELVANAVVHARSPVRLVAAAAYGTLEVGVADLVTRPPRHRRAPGRSGPRTHGHGLMLVEGLADAWGVVPLTLGKQVWFRLDTPTWPWATACACGGSALGGVRLGSGRLALGVPPPWQHPGGATSS